LKQKAIVFVFLTILSLFLLSSQPVEAITTEGYLGEYLAFTIDSPAETKARETLLVDMEFTSTYDFITIEPRRYILAINLDISVYGANASYHKRWENIILDSWETLHENLTVTPTKEGVVTISISANYNYTYVGSSSVGSSSGLIRAPVTVSRGITYEEQSNNQIILYILILFFISTTIVSAIIAAYVAKRKKGV